MQGSKRFTPQGMRGYKIKLLRVNSGQSQSELARLLNISQSTLSRYEMGKLDISVDLLWEIAKVFDVSILILLDEDDIFGEISFTKRKR